MKPRVGIFGLSGCWGEQIVILNCEDQLLQMVGALEIVDFLAGSSANDEESPLDLALVEGSVGSEREEKAVKRIRERSTLLVACGSCACFGGIAGMDARMSRKALVESVYGGEGSAFDAHPHRPLSDYAKVDYALVGCPIEKDEFVQAVSSLLVGDIPLPPTTPVCHECKMLERDCLLISKGLPCAGPVSAAGCGARCPGFNVPCIGCRGPVVEANLESLREVLIEKGLSDEAIRDKLRTFAAPVIEWHRPEGAA
jgi:sulfhydrogenase subunit delta